MSILHDIAAYTGATVVSRDQGMSLQTVDPVRVLGKVKQAIIQKDMTFLIGCESEEKVQQRTNFLNNFCDENLGDFDKEIISERI